MIYNLTRIGHRYKNPHIPIIGVWGLLYAVINHLT